MTIHFTREDLPIRRLASGGLLTIPVFRFTGDQPGKKVYIQGNIHGPEIAGIGAAYELIQLLRQEKSLKGSITIIPSVNPVGLDSKINGYQVGYADLNESTVGNFNRIYQLFITETADEPKKVNLQQFVAEHLQADVPTIVAHFKQALGKALEVTRQRYQHTGMRFGLKLALTIQQLSHDADYLIDLHTAGKAIYHHFTFRECFASGRYFGIQHYIELDRSFNGVLDEAFLQPWLTLHEKLKEAGREIAFAELEQEAFTLELGSADTLEAEAMLKDAHRIMNYLRYKGVLAGEAQLPSVPFYATTQDDYQRYYAPTGGLLVWHKCEGDLVQKGDIFATLLQTYQTQPADASRNATETPLIAVEDGLIINRMESQVVHEGMTICSIGTKLETLTF